MKGYFLTFAMLGGGLITYAAFSLFRQSDEDELHQNHADETLEELTLAEVSQTWTLADNNVLRGEVVNLADMAVIWREPEQKKSAQPIPRPTFVKSEIDQFFTEMVEKRRVIKGDRRIIIDKILKILDEMGDCSSVVRLNKDEAEKQYSDDTFSLLASVPLYQHTLQVARKCVAAVNQEVMLADILIVSLGHDIGKIPHYHNSLYTTGDHPLISVIVLNRIPEYKALANHAELDSIVRGHHNKKPNNMLTDILKRCDQETRKEELAVLVGTVLDRDQGKMGADIPGPLPPRNITEKTTEKRAGTIYDEEERDHPLGGSDPDERIMPVAQKVPDWFDADAILTAIKNKINVVEDTADGARWAAVSSRHGIVYVNPDGLWSALKEASVNNPTLLAADADEEAKSNLLYTVVWELSRVKNAIRTDLVSSKYFTTQATIVTGSGKGFNHLMVPFYVSVFGYNESEANTLEENKSSRLQKMVRDIRPKQEEVEKCAL
jgi:hypothetical protein